MLQWTPLLILGARLHSRSDAGRSCSGLARISRPPCASQTTFDFSTAMTVAGPNQRPCSRRMFPPLRRQYSARSPASQTFLEGRDLRRSALRKLALLSTWMKARRTDSRTCNWWRKRWPSGVLLSASACVDASPSDSMKPGNLLAIPRHCLLWSVAVNSA